jgi:hypothetical protein
VREPVSLVLELLHLAHEVVRALGEAAEQLDETLGDGDDVLGRPVVEVEEFALLRDQAQTCLGRRLSITTARRVNPVLVRIVSASDRVATVIGDGA